MERLKVFIANQAINYQNSFAINIEFDNGALQASRDNEPLTLDKGDYLTT